MVDQREPAACRRGRLLALLLVGVLGIGASRGGRGIGRRRSDRVGRWRRGGGGGGAGGVVAGASAPAAAATSAAAAPRETGDERLLRIARHRWLDERDVRRAPWAEALARIGQRVTDSEKRHTGEIRVCVEAGLPLSYLWRGATARERAITLFGKLRVWDTEQNNGC
jgi:hypothetical protein